jgi:GT2 family glycosyltransferase
LSSGHDRVRVDGKFFARRGSRFRIQGVTYGPFAPDPKGQPFPAPRRVCDDFARMRAVGINSVRTYHVPPEWFLEMADKQAMAVLVDVPWAKHLCFLDSADTQRQARQAVRRAAERGHQHPCILAYSIGNEIPPDVVRWHGARRVERFLAELGDVARQTDPDGLVTYANYPSTEYLDLSFVDFNTFNVYLDDVEAFHRYLFRLQHLAGDKPLVLGEIGMDTLRHGEAEQADFLAGHLREAILTGLAGAFVFSWTDDWHTGGYQIEDWAFGLTRADRSPKVSCEAVGAVFKRSPVALLAETPRVSVVICSYNGGRTLEQCLRSLLALDYPDYEVILVDDGSTDNTREIARRFPAVRAIHQDNQGLSAARNTGLQAATGSLIAYTDSDCFADPDWLTHLVYQLQRSGAAAIGGPNLTPEDGWLAACVAASPGQPTHVLESDQVAEHIPGCNMAFRREALEAINGFDPKYRKAGDDVDLCWRLQRAGMWITFAPGAFVWHHRRQNPRTYLRQQAGYGEAEALLWFAHPDRFNNRGEGKWHGAMYGSSRPSLRIGKPVIYRGTFGAGLFQTLYQPGSAHWTTLPSTLEWHLAAVIAGSLATFWPPARILVAVMLGLSLFVAGLRAAQAPLAPRHRGFRSRLLVAALSHVQPLARSWWRYRTRLFPPGVPRAEQEVAGDRRDRLPLTGAVTVGYWDEAWRERTELLDRIVGDAANHRWATKVDSGWSDWDIEIYCHLWTSLQLSTTQEDHGSGKRLIRVRYRLRPSEYAKVVGAVAFGAAAFTFGSHTLCVAVISFGLLAFLMATWRQGVSLASQAIAIVDGLASEMRLIRCGTSRGREEGSRAHAKAQEMRVRADGMDAHAARGGNEGT